MSPSRTSSSSCDVKTHGTVAHKYKHNMTTKLLNMASKALPDMDAGCHVEDFTRPDEEFGRSVEDSGHLIKSRLDGVLLQSGRVVQIVN